MNIIKLNIARNFISISIGQSIALVINFVSMALTARYLGVINFGLFSYLLSTVIILSKLVDFGLSPIAFRETSKNKTDFGYINSSITIRFLLFAAVLIIFNISMFLLMFSHTEIFFFNILFLNVLISAKIQNIREILDILFKIDLSSHIPVFIIIIDYLIFLTLILLLPLFNGGLTYVVTSYVVSNIPGFILLLFILKRRFNFKLKIVFDKSRWLFKEALPLFGYVLAITVFQQFDIIILKNFDSEYSAGIYSAAARLAMPFNIIPSALVSTIFPLLVRNIGVNEKKNSQLNKLNYKLLLWASFFIAIVSSFKAGEIVVLIFGTEYINAAFPMIILFWSQLFLFYNFYSVDLLTAYNKQKFAFIYAIIVAAINFILLFFLVPEYSYQGASMAKLISLAASSLVIFLFLKKVKLNFSFLNLRIVLCFVLTAMAIYALSVLPLIIYFFVAIFIILLLTLKFKFFSDKEVLAVFSLLNKESWGQRLIKI